METQHAASKFILKGFKVRDILMKQYQSDVLKHITLLLDSQSKIFMITENNEPVGTLNRDQIIAALSKNGKIQL
jgi:hypothetical protein